MRKLFVVSVTAVVAAMAFVPAAQAKRMRKKPAPMMMMAPMNPRIAPNGDFYATPVVAGDPMGMMAPLAIPGAVVGGVTQPVLGGGLPGIDLLPH